MCIVLTLSMEENSHIISQGCSPGCVVRKMLIIGTSIASSLSVVPLVKTSLPYILTFVKIQFSTWLFVILS